MCLVTSQRKPYIAPIDIPVVKVLKVKTVFCNERLEFSTVFRNVPVSLNAVLRAQGSWVNDFDKDRITQHLGKGLIHAYTQRRFAPYDGFQTEPFSITHISAYIPRGTKFFISNDHQTIGAEELYILNHMAPRTFGLTDEQIYDIIALAIWNRKNQ
jgi:hypothetical protein